MEIEIFNDEVFVLDFTYIIKVIIKKIKTNVVVIKKNRKRLEKKFKFLLICVDSY